MSLENLFLVEVIVYILLLNGQRDISGKSRAVQKQLLVCLYSRIIKSGEYRSDYETIPWWRFFGLLMDKEISRYAVWVSDLYDLILSISAACSN